MKIITGSTPAAGEAHGCPFKHMDKGNLTLKLKSLNITQSSVKDVKSLIICSLKNIPAKI